MATLFPGSKHVRECGLLGHTDQEVWEYARDHDFVVASKDADFQQRGLLYGHPPKVIWLRLGNCNRQELVRLVTSHRTDVEAFGANSTEAILVLR